MTDRWNSDEKQYDRECHLIVTDISKVSNDTKSATMNFMIISIAVRSLDLSTFHY